MRIHPYGEGALYVDLEIDEGPDRGARTRAAARYLEERLPGTDVVVGAGTIVLVGTSSWDDLEGLVAEALRAPAVERPDATLHTVRTVYDGPDLEPVARALGLTPGEVIRRHAAAEYTVELVGFLPGFGYLTGLDAALVLPRRSTPRTRVPAGSVAIAGRYTGIYPLPSPGGWSLIGRAVDFVPFDVTRVPPALLRPGDRVRFVRVDVD
jgi:KipI family sensor histidine kinase inhibitor